MFQTSLASRITSTDTSMTLVTNSTGGTAVSGYHCFTIDEGRSDAEFVCGSVSGTTVSSLERGISYTNGTSTVASIEHIHRAGATVKITDYPLIQRLRNLFNGQEFIPNLMTYFTGTACSVGSPNGTICDKHYIDTQVSAGAANGNDTTAGLVQTATGLQAASSTSIGSTLARLTLGANLATSSPWSGASLNIVVSQNDGKISPVFLNGFQDNYTFNGTSTFATSTVASTTITTLNSTGTTTLSNANATSSVAGNWTVAKNASSTNLIASNLVTLPSNCTGCTITSGVSTSTTFTAPNSTVGVGTVTKDIFCVAPKIVVGGGYSGLTGMTLVGNEVTYNAPISSSAWRLVVACVGSGGGSCAGETVTGYAMCVNP